MADNILSFRASHRTVQAWKNRDYECVHIQKHSRSKLPDSMASSEPSCRRLKTIGGRHSAISATATLKRTAISILQQVPLERGQEHRAMDGPGRFVELRLNVEGAKRIVRLRIGRDFLVCRGTCTGHDGGCPGPGGRRPGLSGSSSAGLTKTKPGFSQQHRRRGSGLSLKLVPLSASTSAFARPRQVT